MADLNMSDKGFDIVVIGSGVIGHSIAYGLKLADPTLQVAILGERKVMFGKDLMVIRVVIS